MRPSLTVNSQSPDAVQEQLRGFREGLKDAGFVEGENVAIEYPLDHLLGECEQHRRYFKAELVLVNSAEMMSVAISPHATTVGQGERPQAQRMAPRR